MLKPEMNELLTRTGPKTPMGQALRRYWLPAALSAELPQPDGPPVRLRIMHEDLIAFRDTEGKLGIVQAYCPHRLAPLFYGRNEECGIRCPYHGWKFDVSGKCVDMPNVSSGDQARMRDRAKLTSYPTHEAGGIVWIYMGPKEHQPEFPRFEFTQLPSDQVYAMRWLQRTNWMQGVEGEIDSTHISFLHKHFDQETNPVKGGGSELAQDGAPEITLRPTDYGFTYGARRKYGDQFYWRVTQWMAPMFSLIPRLPGQYIAGGGRAWVPVDDDHVITFHYYFRVDHAIDEEDRKLIDSGVAFPPRLTRGTYSLSNGAVIDTYLPVANKENDYLVDRERQKHVNFSGIWGANEQDRALQECMYSVGPDSPGTVDRSLENLVSSDIAVVTARRRLIELAQAIAAGNPPTLPTGGEAFGVRAISKLSEIDKFDDLLAKFGGETRAPDHSEARSKVSA